MSAGAEYYNITSFMFGYVPFPRCNGHNKIRLDTEQRKIHTPQTRGAAAASRLTIQLLFLLQLFGLS